MITLFAIFVIAAVVGTPVAILAPMLDAKYGM